MNYTMSVLSLNPSHCAKCGATPSIIEVTYNFDIRPKPVVLCPNHCFGFGASTVNDAIAGWNKMQKNNEKRYS